MLIGLACHSQFANTGIGRTAKKILLASPTAFCAFACISIFLFSAVCGARGHEADNNICVQNFGSPLCGQFQILPNIILKSSLLQAELAEKLGRDVTQIAKLGNTGLFLIPSQDPLAESSQLLREKWVEYAQPDIIQQRIALGFATAESHSTTLDSAALKPTTVTSAEVKIAVIDDGFDLNHVAFQNTAVSFSYDSELKHSGALPQSKLDTHGSQVAGIIFAQDDKNRVLGIAPDAGFIAIRQANTRTSDTVLAFTVAELAGADIINCSWNSPVLMQPVFDVIQHLTHAGRSGLGSVIIVAAGNDHREVIANRTEAGIDSVITVGAAFNNKKSDFSNFGNLVDIYLPGQALTTVGQGYGWMHGTSAAAAIASGLAATLLMADSSLSAKQVQEQLVAISNDEARITHLMHANTMNPKAEIPAATTSSIVDSK